MKRKVACGAFWFLFYIDLFVLAVVVSALFTISSDSNTGSVFALLILFALLVGGTIILYRIYDPFREKYSVVHETPLLYHKILCYIGLPLGILMTIASIFNTFTAEDFSSNSLYWVDLFFLFTSLVAACVCLAGLKKLRAYAWYARMLFILLDILYDLAVVVCRIIFAPFSLSSSLVSLMITIYTSAMIALYYYKRKNLFFIPQLADVDVMTGTTNVDEERIEKIVLDEPMKISLSPMDAPAEATASAEWRVPVSDFALDKSAQKPIPYTIPTDTATDKPCDIETPVPIPSTSTTKKKFCSRCGNEIDPSTKKCTGCGKQYFKGVSWKIIISIVVGVVLMASCAFNIWQYVEIADANDTVAKLQKKNVALQGDVDDLKSDLSSQKSKIEFFDEHVVFVEDDGTKLFHKYECERFVGNYYWAYNVELARYNGYKPCSRCH